jgi:hypothetical protein
VTNDVSPQLLLGFLNDAWQRAGDAANSLREIIVSSQVAALSLVKLGSIASVGKNSANQSYSGYGPGKLTHVQIVEAWGNILSLYDQIKSKVTAEFVASADFDFTEPSGFDYDPVCYDLLTRTFTQQSAGSTVSLPDLRELRVPQTVATTPGT